MKLYPTGYKRHFLDLIDYSEPSQAMTGIYAGAIKREVFFKSNSNVMNNYPFELKGDWKFTARLPEMLLSSHYCIAVEIWLVAR